MRVAAMFSIFAAALTLASVVCADIAPDPSWPPRVKRTPIREKPAPLVKEQQGEEAPAHLRKADVSVQLTESSPGWLLAKVRCEWEMVCPKTSKSSQHVAMRFPTSTVTRDSSHKDEKLSVKIDGTSLPSSAGPTKKSWTWEDRARTGFEFTANFVPGRVRKISLNYSVHLRVRENHALFTYFLRTVGGWSGAVGHETVRVKATKGIKIKATIPRNGSLEPDKQSESELVWEIKNAVPGEDIFVAIVTTAADPRVTQAGR